MLQTVFGPFGPRGAGILLGEGPDDKDRKQLTERIIDATLKSVPLFLVRQKRLGDPWAAEELTRRVQSSIAWRAVVWASAPNAFTGQRGFASPQTEEGTDRKLQEMDFPTSDSPLEV